jgi:F0F1-type ATP synthase assembly protein I
MRKEISRSSLSLSLKLTLLSGFMIGIEFLLKSYRNKVDIWNSVIPTTLTGVLIGPFFGNTKFKGSFYGGTLGLLFGIPIGLINISKEKLEKKYNISKNNN